MKTTVTTHRILATLIVVLIAALIPFGRTVERAVQLISFPLHHIHWTGVGGLVVASVLTVPYLARLRTIPWHASGLGLTAIVAVTLLSTAADWCHFALYGLLAIGLVGAQPHPLTVRLSLICGLFIGIIDELVQGCTPGRIADPWDVVIDVWGLLVGVWLHRAVLAATSVRSPCPAGGRVNISQLLN